MNHSIVKSEEISSAVWGTLINSVFPGANENSVLMAVQYCEARGLDVLKKPVHIVPMSVKDAKSGQYQWRDIIMPGISELRTTASRSSAYGGQSAPEFGETKDFKIGKVSIQAPESCTVTVFKLINGQQIGFSHTEFFTEACATTKNGDLNSMWTKRPRGQLAKCAEAGALRKAFPEDLGGEISYDEMVEGNMLSPNGQSVIVDTISKSQAADVEALLEEVGADRSGFAQWILNNFKATSIEKIPANALETVISKISSKKEQQHPEAPEPVEQEVSY